MIHDKTLVPGLSFIALLGALPVQAGPIDPAGILTRSSAKAVHEAQHDVDHAWEVYHRAALGGTVASPALQADIEEHLHEARTLITQAQEAAERGDDPQVKRLVSQVKVHTTRPSKGVRSRRNDTRSEEKRNQLGRRLR